MFQPMQLKTGDIVLFHGKGFFSWAIKFSTKSNWSHVGMVVNDPDVHEEPMIFESTTLSNVRDSLTGKRRGGVQLVSYKDRINSYNGKIAVRPLNVSRSDAFEEKVKNIINQLHGREYEESLWQLANSSWDLLPISENKEDLSSVFCSELVAHIYQELGFLDESKPSNEYTPGDFEENAKLELLTGKLLGEVPVKG
ncbi:MAG: hypothetical protein AAGA80_28105 [Cyanobacteria bacterium P01_F01_bin.143]